MSLFPYNQRYHASSMSRHSISSFNAWRCYDWRNIVREFRAINKCFHSKIHPWLTHPPIVVKRGKIKRKLERVLSPPKSSVNLFHPHLRFNSSPSLVHGECEPHWWDETALIALRNSHPHFKYVGWKVKLDQNVSLKVGNVISATNFLTRTWLHDWLLYHGWACMLDVITMDKTFVEMVVVIKLGKFDKFYCSIGQLLTWWWAWVW